MRRVGLVFLAVFLMGLPTGAAASPPYESGYYEVYDRTFTIRDDRLLDVYDNITLYNSGPRPIEGVRLTVPYTDIQGLYASDDKGELIYDNGDPMYSVIPLDSTSRIEVNFRAPIFPHSSLTFYLTYTLGGVIKGSGVEYRGSLGGMEARDSRYDNYVLTVVGPSGSGFFLSNPLAELIDSRTVRYSTPIAAHKTFDGLEVRFYKQPAFYKLTLEERFTNNTSSPTTNLKLDAMLFTEEAGWQFSALASSNWPIKTMYVDKENNWHGFFEVGEVGPGETRTIQLELLYEVGIHDPGIGPEGAGLISEMPAWLDPYLDPRDKWESDNFPIKQKATDAVAGQDNVYLAAKQILNSVAESLEYKRQDNRHGALWALQNGIGDCSEYTDLAIALARAAKIPARAMYGWAYQEDNLGLHGWMQFYLPNKGWQPADPTWAETSGDYLCRLDPIHLTRNVRGLSSEETGATTTYYGKLTWTENATVEVLSRSGVASYYVSAAQYAVNLADALLEASPDETLQAKQNDAKQALTQAQATTDENQKILHAKSSLQNANEVIRALGKKPTEAEGWLDLERLFPFLAAVGVITAIALAVYAILRRRR